VRRPLRPGRERARLGGGCADFASFARFPVKTRRRRHGRLVPFPCHPFRCR
jgi:hypothetical protein